MLGSWAIVDIFVGFILNGLDNFKAKRMVQSIIPQVADPKKLCKTPHSWIMAPTITKEGQGFVQVCRVCGFISGSDKVASMDSIDRIEENNRIREIESRLLKDFLTQEDDQMKKYFDLEIKGGLNFDKLAHIHGAGMTFNQRFLVYKASRAEEIEKELTKSDA